MKRLLFATFLTQFLGSAAFANLENHYTFDSEDTLTNDSSGNDRHAFIDDLEVEKKGRGFLFL